MYWGLPLMGVTTAAGAAQPPGLEVRAERHLRGLPAVLSGMPLLDQVWPAGQRGVACAAIGQPHGADSTVLTASKCLSAPTPQYRLDHSAVI